MTTSTSLIFVVGIVLIASFIQQQAPSISRNYDGMIAFLLQLLDRGYLPDFFIRAGTIAIMEDRLNDLHKQTSDNDNYLNDFINDLNQRPIAEETDAANEQQYEVDPSFYNLTLGKYRKYSCSLFGNTDIVNNSISINTNTNNIGKNKDYSDIGAPSASLTDAYTSLDEAEKSMLDLYITRAGLCIGNDCNLNVLDLGCGWGAFSLYYARLCPNCTITSISNSQSQIKYITKLSDLYNI